MPENRTNVLLWFAFVGGALIWFFQFSIFYGLSEIRCKSDLLNFSFLGLSGVRAISLLTGIIALGLVLYAVFISLRQRYSSSQISQETLERRSFMARASLYMNVLYLLAIIATIIPVFFLPVCL